MHERHIAHRDLKPENILISDKLHIKITDFGDSKVFGDQAELDQDAEEEGGTEEDDRNSLFQDDEKEAHQAPRGSFVGTPLYVAPEMLNENRSGPSNDMWALGCIIYQMLTGNVPFTG